MFVGMGGLLQARVGIASSGPTLISSYDDTSDWDEPTDNFSGSELAIGQTFTSSFSLPIGSAKFYLKKTGTPTGNVVAVKLYAITGTVGSTAKPSGLPGTELAISNTINVALLTTSYVLTTFTFSAANNYVLSSGTGYFIGVEWVGSGTNGNTVDVAGNVGNLGSPGNVAFFNVGDTSWTSAGTPDMMYYLYST